MRILGLSAKDSTGSSIDDSQLVAEEEKVFQVIDFSVAGGFDHLNLNKLVRFCETSKLPQKLAAFKPAAVTVHADPVGGLKSFLNQLKPDENCRPEKVKTTGQDEDAVTEEKVPMMASPLMTVRTICELFLKY